MDGKGKGRMTYISIVHDEKTRKKHITVDKDGEIHHYVVNDTVLDALITHTMFPGSRIRPAGDADTANYTEKTEKTENTEGAESETETREAGDAGADGEVTAAKGKAKKTKKGSKKDGNHS